MSPMFTVCQEERSRICGGPPSLLVRHDFRVRLRAAMPEVQRNLRRFIILFCYILNFNFVISLILNIQ